MDLNSILIPKISEFFPDGKEKKGEWWTLNPLRADNSTGSFSINLTTGLWKDFADNSSGNLVNLICDMKGLKFGELAKQYGFTAEKQKQFHHFKLGYPSAIYPYHTIDGKLVGHVCRFETKTGKEHRPYSNNKWSKEGFPVPHPLYNCHKLIQGKKILIVEGEKTANAAQQLLGEDFVVLTWLGGAAAALLSDWSILSNYNQIYLWPDNDAGGINAMQTICTKLLTDERKLTEQVSTKIVDISLLNLPKGWDLADVDETWTRDKIIEILENAKSPYKPHPAIQNEILFVAEIESEENNLVKMNSNGIVIGNNYSTIILFCIDYFKASYSEYAVNKIFLMAMDGKLLLRKIKIVKKEPKIVFEKMILSEVNFTKCLDYYNKTVQDYGYSILKKKLAYNGCTFEKCKKILMTLLKYALVDTTECEACAISLIHFILQTKLKMHNRHEVIPYHSMAVFLNKLQGSGKTDFVRAFCECLGEYYGEMSINQVTDERNFAEMTKYLVLFCDDFHKIFGQRLDMFKNIITAHYIYARILKLNRGINHRQNCTFIGTAQTENLGDKVIDESGNRRFVPFLTNSFVNQEFYPHDFDLIKHFYKQKNPKYVYPVHPVNEMDFTSIWQSVDENWFLENWYIKELEKYKEVQSKHMTKSSVDEFLDRYEVQKSHTWIPTAMVYCIYMKETKDAENIGNFTKALRQKFGVDSCAVKRLNNKIQRAYCISFNSAFDDKIKKEFKSVTT